MSKDIINPIETERLVLREINDSDAEMIVFWRSEPSIYRFFKSPHKISIEEHRNWFFNNYLHNENRFDWIVIDKFYGKKIGVFGLSRENEKAEVNYLLDPQEQHKGFAFEALSALISFVKNNWNCKHIIAEIHMDNNSSISLIEKLGFKLLSSDKPFLTFGIEV